MTYCYQEWQDGLHSFDDHVIVSLELGLCLRANLQVSTTDVMVSVFWFLLSSCLLFYFEVWHPVFLYASLPRVLPVLIAPRVSPCVLSLSVSFCLCLIICVFDLVFYSSVP